jgi:putative transcriptional regulator
MNSIKAIRDRLGVTQDALAKGMGCTQGNVGHYERGQTVPPEMAKRLIGFAASLNQIVTFDEIYGQPPSSGVASVESRSGIDRRQTVRRQSDRNPTVKRA